MSSERQRLLQVGKRGGGESNLKKEVKKLLWNIAEWRTLLKDGHSTLGKYGSIHLFISLLFNEFIFLSYILTAVFPPLHLCLEKSSSPMSVNKAEHVRFSKD